MIKNSVLDQILADGVKAHVDSLVFTDEERDQLQRRWNQLRGNDCAIDRGTHLSPSEIETVKAGLEYTTVWGDSRQEKQGATDLLAKWEEKGL